MRLRHPLSTTLLAGSLTLLITAAPAHAQTSLGPWNLSGSLRVRQEFWDWFQPADTRFENQYNYTGALLRLGADRKVSLGPVGGDALAELAVPSLWNLPEKASAPPPQGGLGVGALYRAFNGAQNGSLFLKQGYLRLSRGLGKGNSLRAGRFEFGEGKETTPTDPALAWIKSQRVAERLLGTFAWTHVGRSFDGAHLSANRPTAGGADNLTLVAAYPTRGVFDLDGQDTMTSVRFAYLGATRSRARSDARVFAIAYEDTRNVARVDNSTIKDREPIKLLTVGGHYLATFGSPAGKLDLMFWGALQSGDWGRQNARGSSYAVEAGVRPKGAPANLWLRGGYFLASGDGNPADNNHATFYPLLNTPRAYARTPFYAEANVQDAFIQAILRPDPRLNVRLDLHRISVASTSDLWYVAGGPFEKGEPFGLIGRPVGGRGSLADFIDLSADFQVNKRLTLSGYYGLMRGKSIIGNIYPDRTGSLGYLEVTTRF